MFARHQLNTFYPYGHFIFRQGGILLPGQVLRKGGRPRHPSRQRLGRSARDGRDRLPRVLRRHPRTRSVDGPRTCGRVRYVQARRQACRRMVRTQALLRGRRLGTCRPAHRDAAPNGMRDGSADQRLGRDQPRPQAGRFRDHPRPHKSNQRKSTCRPASTRVGRTLPRHDTSSAFA